MPKNDKLLILLQLPKDVKTKDVGRKIYNFIKDMEDF